MSWATNYIKQLQEGKPVEFRPRGNSMTGLVNDGDLVRIIPYDQSRHKLVKDLVVLCKVKKSHYLHKISAVKPNQVQISNNHGHVNGWISLNNVYGILDANYGK